jgi:hypothetical protein
MNNHEDDKLLQKPFLRDLALRETIEDPKKVRIENSSSKELSASQPISLREDYG